MVFDIHQPQIATAGVAATIYLILAICVTIFTLYLNYKQSRVKDKIEETNRLLQQILEEMRRR